MSSTWTASICKSNASMCINVCSSALKCVLTAIGKRVLTTATRSRVDCGCYGCPGPCTCQPAGFGTNVAKTVNALGKKLLQKKRKLTVALGVLKKDLNGQLVHPPYVCMFACRPSCCTEAMPNLCLF